MPKEAASFQVSSVLQSLGAAEGTLHVLLTFFPATLSPVLESLATARGRDVEGGGVVSLADPRHVRRLRDRLGQEASSPSRSTASKTQVLILKVPAEAFGAHPDGNTENKIGSIHPTELRQWLCHWLSAVDRHAVIGLTPAQWELVGPESALKAGTRRPSEVAGLQVRHHLLPPPAARSLPPGNDGLQELLDAEPQIVQDHWWAYHSHSVSEGPHEESYGPDDFLTQKLELARHILFERLSPAQRRDLVKRWSARLGGPLWTEPAPAPHSDPRPNRPLDLLQLCGLAWRDGATPGGWAISPLIAPYLSRTLSSVRLHHISDVHFGGPQGWSTGASEPASAPVPKGEDPILRSARNALTEFERPQPKTSDPTVTPHNLYLDTLEHRRPAAVIFSGDLTFRGREDGLTAGVEWLGRIRKRLQTIHISTHGPNVERLLVVGGNHDVERPDRSYTDPQERHRRFRDRVIGKLYDANALDRLSKGEPRQHSLDEVEIHLLESAALAGEPNQVIYALLDDMAALKSAVRSDELSADSPALKALERYDALRKIVKDDHGTMDPGTVDPKAIDALTLLGKLPASAEPRASEPVRLVVLHHPVSPIPGGYTKEYPVVTNATSLKRALFAAGVRLLLHGHEHRYHVAVERWQSSAEGAAGSQKGEIIPLTEALVQVSAPTLASLETDDGQGFVELELLVERSTEGQVLSVDVRLAHWRLEKGGERTFDFVEGDVTPHRVFDANELLDQRLLSPPPPKRRISS